MTNGISAADRSALDAVVGKLAAAWNANDAVAFAVSFAPDADFVNILAEHHQGARRSPPGTTQSSGPSTQAAPCA